MFNRRNVAITTLIAIFIAITTLTATATTSGTQFAFLDQVKEFFGGSTPSQGNGLIPDQGPLGKMSATNNTVAPQMAQIMSPSADTIVTIGGGASITCPATPTATFTTPPAGVTFSNWSRGSGVTCGSAADGISGSGFNTANAAASFTANAYYKITITADATHTFTLSSIKWLGTISSGTGTFTVKTSNNGGAATDFGTATAGVTGSAISSTFTGTVNVAAGTSVDVFLIPSNTTAVGTTVRFKNSSTITVNAVAAGGTAPILTSPTATGIGTTSATLGANITSDGGSSVTARGTVWKTSSPVTATDNALAEGGTTTGVFTHSRTSLPAGSQIFYAGYATNSGTGTGLSPESSFFTLSLEPTAHAGAFTSSPVSGSQIDLSFSSASTIPNGAGYIVLRRQDGTFPDATGVNDATAPGSLSLPSGTTLVTTVASAAATSFSDTGLSPGVTYSYALIPFGYNGTNAQTYNYFTAATIPTTSSTTTTTTATKFAITAISPATPTAGSTFNVTVQSQDNGNSPVNVIANTGFTLSTNGNAGTIGGTTTGTILAGTNQIVVTGVTLSTGGTGATLTATQTSGDALTAGTSSAFAVLSAQPTVQATAVVFTAITSNSMTVNWTNGDGTIRIVIARQGSAVNGPPVDGTTYTDNAAFGSGSVINTTNFVVYKGTGSSVNVTGLAGATTYHFAVYEFNGAGGTENYLTTTPAIGSQVTNANICTSIATGLWNNPLTWSNCGGSFPGTADTAIVDNSTVVTLDSSRPAANVTVNGGSTLDASTFTLTVSGTFTLAASSTFKQGGTVSSQPGSIRVFDPTSTFVYNGAQTAISAPGNFGNLIWSSSANASPGSNLTITGNLTLFNSLQLRGSTGTTARTHSVSGNVVVDGASAVLVGTNAGATPNNGIWNITGNVTTQNGGILRGNNPSAGATGTFNIGGNLTNNGIIEHGTGGGLFVINLNGTSVQIVSGTAIAGLQDVGILNAAGVVLSTNATLTGTLTLSNGNITTGANTLAVSSIGSVVHTSGHVIGTLQRTFAAAGSLTFDVGTTNGYSPVAVSATAGTFPADFTVKAIQGAMPAVTGTNKLARYWTLTNTTISSADLTFNYLAGDVTGTSANYKFIKNTGGTLTVLEPTPTPTDTQASISGVTSFSDWTLAETSALPPPTVTSVNPTSGTTAGGTSVVITGTNFTGATAVSFGGTAATGFTVNSATQITATTAAHAAGAVSVDVTTPGGTNGANTLYTYVAPPAGLTYSTNPATYVAGTAITNNSPSSTGGAVVSYSVSPGLPAGLTLDTTTGVISGTPTAATVAADYTVTATNSGGTTTATVNITVVGGSTVQFSAATYLEDESQTAVITVTRSGDTSGTSTVDYATSNGTATGGVSPCGGSKDYLTASGTLNFAANEASKTFNVPLCADDIAETTETVNLTLSSATGIGTTLGAQSTAVLNINDTATSFENMTPITVGASPNSSDITVSGGPTTLSGSMRVTLYDVNFTNANNLDVLLVGPGGRNILLMADAGGSGAVSATITLRDPAGVVIPNGAISTGAYEATSWEPGQVDFASPAPVGPYNEPGSAVGGTPSLASVFGGMDTNGTWSLYVRDDNGAFAPAASGTIGGWGLQFFGPTAGAVSLSGRVLTANGQGLKNAVITVSGNGTASRLHVLTGPFGYYQFDGLAAGETYVVTVNSRSYTFAQPSRIVTLNDSLGAIDFTADPQ